jgi:beta-lactamase superfamily II metal-dependent hydrolase
MFQLTLFPALDGDCLLLSYGEDNALRHVLVDGGRTRTYDSLRRVLAQIGQRGERIELLVLTHIDADHIEGFLRLATDQPLPAQVAEIWFNGFDQLSSVRAMGPGQGDRFSQAIKTLNWKTNARFEGRAIALADAANSLSVTLAGELKLTILSPDAGRVSDLRDEWEKWRTEAAAKAAEAERKRAKLIGLQSMGRRPFPRILDIDTLADGPETIDDEAPNGSSIAFVAEWQKKRVIFGADAHPDLLAQAIKPLAALEGGRYCADLYKVSHHGSRANTTRELVACLNCTRFAISTNGSHHGHPDPETIAKLIKYAPDRDKQLYFNYRQERTTSWSDRALEQKYAYVCCFPTGTDGEISIPI